MVTILILTGVILLLILADLMLAVAEKAERGQRMQRDNEDLIRTVRAQHARIRRLENRVSAGNWSVTSEAERRCAELEMENSKLRQDIKIKNALIEGAEKMRRSEKC